MKSNSDQVQHWEKVGRIFDPASMGRRYASVPFAMPLASGNLKIFYSYRDEHNRSHLASFCWNPLKPFELWGHSIEALLSPGKAGFFDEDGVMATAGLPVDEKWYIFYIGWNLAASVPFRNSIGLAMSTDEGKSFTKFATGPILDRSIYDPCFVASNCVLHEAGRYRMWYLSCIDWEKRQEGFRHFYHIKYAESKNGIDWHREGKICIDFTYTNEYAISVPRVIRAKDGYKMWYSFREGPTHTTYRVGYAESEDGLDWKRKDELVELSVSEKGWDADMICYPFVFDYEGRRYMLYNGNDYGETGIGLARLT